MSSRNLELTISLDNVRSGIEPFLNATTFIGEDEEITKFNFVKFDPKSKTLKFKGIASKQETVLH